MHICCHLFQIYQLLFGEVLCIVKLMAKSQTVCCGIWLLFLKYLNLGCQTLSPLFKQTMFVCGWLVKGLSILTTVYQLLQVFNKRKNAFEEATNHMHMHRLDFDRVCSLTQSAGNSESHPACACTAF